MPTVGTFWRPTVARRSASASFPSTLVAYLQPFGIRFSSLFPFVSTPAAPAAAIRAVLDETYPTASVPATMPLLFLLACWGTITAFRPKALVPFRLTRIVLLAGAAAMAGVLLWGYIGERYLADFMPFLIVASGVGLIDDMATFRRAVAAEPGGRVLGILSVVAVYCVAVNMAIAATPSEQFHAGAGPGLRVSPRSPSASRRWPTACSTGAPCRTGLRTGSSSWSATAPGLYLASGIDETNVPGLLIDHYTWIPVEQDPAFTRQIWFTFNRPAKDFTRPVTLMTYGASSLVLKPAGYGLLSGRRSSTRERRSAGHATDLATKPISVLHEPFQLQVTTDPNLHQILVLWFGTVLHHTLHRRVRSDRRAHHPDGAGWATPRGHRGDKASPLQPEPVPEPAARRLTEPVASRRVPRSARVRSAVTSPLGPSRPILQVRLLTKSKVTRSRGTFSCVVDEHPRFHLDALRWFVSLTTIAGVDPRDLVVHVVGSDNSDALVHLRSRGVTVRSIDRFDSRSPHCNKVAGALRLAEEQTEGLVVLCDTDVAVLEDPRALALPPGSIGGKVVDTPVPPLEVLHEIFAAAEVPAPPITPLPWGDDQATVVGNSNGGLYLIPATLLPVLAPAWETWARWLLDRRELLRDWTFHLDQVAMALALTAEGIGSEQLDVRWNTPIHDLTRIPPDPPIPAIIHYHQEIDQQGRIRMTGSPSIDRQIERVNEAIGDCGRRPFRTPHSGSGGTSPTPNSDPESAAGGSPSSPSVTSWPPFSTPLRRPRSSMSDVATARRRETYRCRAMSGSTYLPKRFAGPSSVGPKASSSLAVSPISPSEPISPSVSTC